MLLALSTSAVLNALRTAHSTVRAVSSFVIDSSFIIRHSSLGDADPFRSPVCRDRPDRVSLLLGRPRRSIGLHRDDDVVWLNGDNHSPDRARAECFGRDDWHVAILARRLFLVETVLA